MAQEDNNIDKEKLDQLKKERDAQKGIPIDNDQVSKDPNKRPVGSDEDAKIKRKGDHVEPYNDQKYDPDPKDQRNIRDGDRG